MIFLLTSLLTMGLACGFVMAPGNANAASEFALPEAKALAGLPLSVTTTVEKHTAKINMFSEAILMTAHVGELWQAQGDVLYQTNNHDVTDLAIGDDGRYAVKFTNPGEATIRVYVRKDGEMYVQDFRFTILEGTAGTYAANKPDEGSASGAIWSAGSEDGSEGSQYRRDPSASGTSPTSSKTASTSESVYVESNRGAEAFPEEVLQLVNVERAKVGAAPLRLNNELQNAAVIRAEEITRHFAHERPDGSSCFTLLRNRNRTLGENIAAGNATPEEVVDQWMHSPGHRANILNKAFKELGVGYCCKEGTEYTHYWIQMFRG